MCLDPDVNKPPFRRLFIWNNFKLSKIVESSHVLHSACQVLTPSVTITQGSKPENWHWHNTVTLIYRSPSSSTNYPNNILFLFQDLIQDPPFHLVVVSPQVFHDPDILKGTGHLVCRTVPQTGLFDASSCLGPGHASAGTPLQYCQASQYVRSGSTCCPNGDVKLWSLG